MIRGLHKVDMKTEEWVCFRSNCAEWALMTLRKVANDDNPMLKDWLQKTEKQYQQKFGKGPLPPCLSDEQNWRSRWNQWRNDILNKMTI